MFGFITQLRAKPGKRDALIQVNERMQAVTAGEDGVLIYAFHTADSDPDLFWYYDLYTDEEAFETHCATPEYKQMGEVLPDLADVLLVERLTPFGKLKTRPIPE